jgi:redox-sensitive bicupin YhaK (pirin superfamily)
METEHSDADIEDHSRKLAGGFTLRAARDRGQADFGWLKSAHSFSFGSYYDPAHMGFGALRVINDDWVAAGAGFPAHAHRDAEIFSYVLEGAIEHKDSLGNGSTVTAGGVQYMSAGAGVTHSEYNPSGSEPMRFLQVWLTPMLSGLLPRYDTVMLNPGELDGKLKLFLSPEGRDGSLMSAAPANVYAAKLGQDQKITATLAPHLKAWVQVAEGSLSINGVRLNQGDGLSISEGGRVEFSEGESAHVLYFELFDSPN